MNATTTEEDYLEDLDEEDEEEEGDEDLAGSSNNTDSIIRRSKGKSCNLIFQTVGSSFASLFDNQTAKNLKVSVCAFFCGRKRPFI